MPTAANIGLGNVDNTSDANKPVSTATAAALGGKVNTGAVSSSGLTMATARLLGRSTSGSGALEEITLGTNLSFSGTTLNATGGGGSPGGSSGQIQWNSSGSFAGVSTTSVDGSGNLTFTGRWIQSTNGAASAPPMSLTGTWFTTGGTSTTTKAQLLIEPAGTTSTNWNTAGTGLGVNAPSGFGGDLAWFGVGGNNLARINSSGNVLATGSFVFPGNGIGLHQAGGDTFYLGKNDSRIYLFAGGNQTISIGANSYIGWTASSSNVANNTPDLLFLRDAANTFAQRNGTAAQTSRIYNTFTSDTNYERLAHTWVSNVCYTRPENAGTGSARLYVPVTGGTTVANLPAAATAGTGARSFVTDANATTFLSTVAGGGSNRVPVVSDGTNWLIA